MICWIQLNRATPAPHMPLEDVSIRNLSSRATRDPAERSEGNVEDPAELSEGNERSESGLSGTKQFLVTPSEVEGRRTSAFATCSYFEEMCQINSSSTLTHRLGTSIRSERGTPTRKEGPVLATSRRPSSWTSPSASKEIRFLLGDFMEDYFDFVALTILPDKRRTNIAACRGHTYYGLSGSLPDSRSQSLRNPTVDKKARAGDIRSPLGAKESHHVCDFHRIGKPL